MDISVVWDHLITVAGAMSSQEFAFNMRRRANPHHPQEDIDAETEAHMKSIEKDFFALKEIYVQNREALRDSKGNEERRIAFVEAMEKVLDNEVESIIFKTNVDE